MQETVFSNLMLLDRLGALSRPEHICSASSERRPMLLQNPWIHNSPAIFSLCCELSSSIDTPDTWAERHAAAGYCKPNRTRERDPVA
jgi:hypothetical protein